MCHHQNRLVDTSFHPKKFPQSLLLNVWPVHEILHLHLAVHSRPEDRQNHSSHGLKTKQAIHFPLFHEFLHDSSHHSSLRLQLRVNHADLLLILFLMHDDNVPIDLPTLPKFLEQNRLRADHLLTTPL